MNSPKVNKDNTLLESNNKANSTQQNVILEIENIKKDFGNTEVLKGINLKVNKGDVVAILGPSGAGKTTLLRCLNFLEKANDGTIIFDGKEYDAAKATKKKLENLG